MIPELITGDIKYDLSIESKNQLLNLNIDPIFIDFFIQYNSQEVFNEIQFKDEDTGISCFSKMATSLKERNERMLLEGNEDVFGHSIIFAYGPNTYYEYTYKFSGVQKGKVFGVIINHIDLKTNRKTFVIDDRSVILLANSFEEFIINLSMGETDVVNRERKRKQILLTKINGDRVSIMIFLKKEKRLKTYEEVKSLLN